MKNKILTVLVSMVFLITSISVAAIGKTNNLSIKDDIETSSYIVIYNDNAESVASNLLSNGFDVMYNTISQGSFEMIVSPHELVILEDQGFEIEILSKGRPFVEIQEEWINDPQNTFVPPGYQDYSDIFESMINTQLDYPEICKVYDLTDTYEMSPTYEDRHIFAMKISDNVEEDENESNFLLVSCHHAREISTPVIALYAIEQFTTEYGNDPSITSAVDDYEIWIVPVWNPDGYEYCYYVDNWWRKNRNPPDGVDLNRNYPFGWSSGCSGSTDPYSETYKGTSPASEVETQTMIAFSDDRHFVKVIDFHSYGREVLYGYCCHSHPFSSFFQSEAVSLSSAAGYGGSIRLASAEGEEYQWQIWKRGTYANLMETHVEFQPSYASAEAEATQVWPSILWMLERPISISGKIVDSISGEPLVMPINIDVSFSNEEGYYNEPRFGRYEMILPPGTYNLEFSYENYHTQTHEVTVTGDSTEILDIELVRLNEAPNKPTIDGPRNIKVGDTGDYDFKASDPDTDDLEYYINWGDGNIEEWIGPYNSDEEVTLSHQWTVDGSFTIEAKVRDPYGEESDIESLQVTVEKKARNRIFDLPFWVNFQWLIKIFKFYMNI